jgi:hypothetical protein
MCYISFIFIQDNISSSSSKDKTIQLQAWTGPKGSRKLRLIGI